MARKKNEETTASNSGAKAGGPLAAAHSVMAKVFPGEKSAEVMIDENRFTQSLPHLPIGSSVLDHLVGGIPNSRGVLPCPGLPRGRIVNLYGAESSGKTTVCLTVAAETCRRGGTVAYIDWEHAIDIAYAKNLGVPIDDPNKFVLIQPESLEKGLAYLFIYAKAGVDLVVVDSVAAAATAAQWEQSIEDSGSVGRVGAKAAMWSEFLPKLKALIARSNTCVIGISQLRSKIDTGFSKGAGEKTQQQGGYAWKFYSEVRMGLRKWQTEKGKRYDPLTHTQIDVAVGNIVVAKIDKCKVSASQGREAKFYIMFGEGIDDLRSLIEIAASRGIIKKSGSWYSWERANGTSLRSQGVEALKEQIRNANALEELHKVALSALANNPDAPVGMDGDFEEEEDPAVQEVMGILQGPKKEAMFEEEE